MDVHAIQAELLARPRFFGVESRRLRVGEDAVNLVGLDAGLTAILDRRFGAFVLPGETGASGPSHESIGEDYCLEVVRSRRKHWLVQRAGAEPYRFEAVGPPGSRVVLSYHFALCALPPNDADGGLDGSDANPCHRWRVALAEDPTEPLGRILDNVARFLAARAAIDRGGFAMHGAGVLRDGRAHVFAGPSRSGKSTAVRLSEPALSLGDDFAIVVPRHGQWFVPALPFDNAERIDHVPPHELAPLATIWRLFQAERHSVARPVGLSAVTSLLGCVAFPWVVPECAELLLSRVAQVVEDGRFGHLHFRPDSGFWSLLG